MLSYMGLLRDPEALPMARDHGAIHYINMAVRASKAMCGRAFASSVVLLLVLFMVLVITLSILLNRLTEAHRIRRYDA